MSAIARATPPTSLRNSPSCSPTSRSPGLIRAGEASTRRNPSAPLSGQADAFAPAILAGHNRVHRLWRRIDGNFKLLGFDVPVGRRDQPRGIVGVIEDSHRLGVPRL